VKSVLGLKKEKTLCGYILQVILFRIKCVSLIKF